jgi:penicillin-binding protein 1C
MNFLHRDDPSTKRGDLPNLVRREIEFPQGIAPPREEWFIRGTEPNSRDQRIGPFNSRIVYPPSGMVIALDPDIPLELQKMFFISQTNENEIRWVLNGVTLERVGKTVPWTPKAGKYFLALADGEEKILDYVYFEVRGQEAD